MQLRDERDGFWTRNEFDLELSSPTLAVEDALASLQGAGLVHLQNDLVLVTSAAQRMDQLSL